VLESHYSEKMQLEWNAFECPSFLISTFKQIFPDADLSSKQLTIVPTWQQTKNDMSGYSDDTLQEREEKGLKFVKWGEQVCEELKKRNYWADLIDPQTALPHLSSRGGTTYMETDDAVYHLGYEIVDLGCCKIVCHKKWNTMAFLATLFTTAPAEVLNQVLLQVEKNTS